MQLFVSRHLAVGGGIVAAQLRFVGLLGAAFTYTNYPGLARAKLSVALDDEAWWRIDLMAALGPERSHVEFEDGSQIYDTGVAFLGGVGLLIGKFHMAVEYYRSGTQNCDHDIGACWPTPSGLAISAGMILPIALAP